MGGIIIGKTNTPEFGAGSQTFNKIFGATPNPWNLDYTAGGSSGGSAAAVSGQLTPITIGTDTGGSIRQPASFTGTVGLRPTAGTVAHGPQNLPFNGLSVDGPMARTVEDIALFLDTMSGLDSRDPLSVNAPHKPYHKALNEDVPKLNIGISDDYGFLACAPEVPAASNKAEKFLNIPKECRKSLSNSISKMHRYSASRGISGLRKANAKYYERRFNVKLDYDKEVIATIGSKEGLANMAQVLASEGDTILVPNPAYSF